MEGDDVYGTARKAFDLDKRTSAAAAGRSDLAEKPTVILICYGANEAFEGDAGLDKFKKGYEKLLNDLTPTKARIILMSPPPLEKKPDPLPDPGLQNKRLAVYRDAIKQIATTRKHYFADLFAVMGEGNAPPRDATDNGVHFTDQGYKMTTAAFAAALGLPTAETDVPEPLRAPSRRRMSCISTAGGRRTRRICSGSASTSREEREGDRRVRPLIAAAEVRDNKLLKK